MSKRDDEFTVYVAAHRRRLVRAAFLLCGSWAQAEDVTQISLAKLYVAWPRIDRSRGPDAYARRIITRTIFDESRHPGAGRNPPAAGTAARRWFGRNTAEGDYRAIQQQLCTIGWELPNDDYATESRRKIGATACCRRTIISLNAVDVAENPNIEALINITMRLQDLAAWTCCGAKRFQQAMREPTWSHAPGPR